ncbi:hypothetical protein [Arthrobacter sp. SO5]|uniref:hypothetical protein n=1 Tax=Arthrobacter sp. SO5 TaxID=1897055 RepID=UPI001E514E89|nr:hypothetical protein [Arthrobacter sp. SO5]
MASELKVDIHVLALEARRAGIPVRGTRDLFMLFEVEAEQLREFASSAPKQNAEPTNKPDSSKRPTLADPDNYRPSPDGRITLRAYDSLEHRFAADLVQRGFLPKRRAVKALPGLVWPQILDHRKWMEQIARASKEQRHPSNTDVVSNNPAVRPAQRPANSNHVATSRSGNSLQFTGAIKPPKPDFAVAIQRAQAMRSVAAELNPEIPSPREIKLAAQVDPLPTAIGKGSAAIEALEVTLRGFAPKDHAVFFGELEAALELDERIVRSAPVNTDTSRMTDRPLRSLVRLVCSGKFGLFAYHEVSNTIRSAARKNSRNASPASMARALMDLRPMYTGVLTDAGKSRFIFWLVEQDGTQLAVVTFGAMSDWVRGMRLGQYVPLRGRLMTVSRHVKLTDMDREDAQFMAEAAFKLREGIKIRRTATVSDEPRGRNYLDTRAAALHRTLTYKPHSGWLIPVVIENGFATAGLQEGFFSNHGGRSAHEVRPFMRRAPGTSRNAPKTVSVSAHTRGGYEVGDIGFMPTVTILRELGATERSRS